MHHCPDCSDFCYCGGDYEERLNEDMADLCEHQCDWGDLSEYPIELD